MIKVIAESPPKTRSVCYVNPTTLIRRPISELLALEEGVRRVGLLTPIDRSFSRSRKHASKKDGVALRNKEVREHKLHHTALFKRVEMFEYHHIKFFGPFEWPVPLPSFFVMSYRALKEFDVFHIWAHFYLSTLLFMLMSLFFPKKKIILTLDTLPGYSFSMGGVLDLAFKVYTWTLGKIVYWVPNVITLYGKALLIYARASGIRMNKVKVVPTGIINHKLLSKKEARKRLMNEFHLSQDERIVIYGGLLNPRKRVSDLLLVAERFKEDAVTFLIVGDGPSRNYLEKEAKRRSLKNIFFQGWRKDFLILLRGSDALLFPSSAEGLPGVVMEAMLTKTPVVTTRIPCTTDLIRHGREGLLSKVGDIDSMALNLKKLFEGTKLAHNLTSNARERLKLYSWSKVLSKYELLYDA